MLKRAHEEIRVRWREDPILGNTPRALTPLWDLC